MSVGRAVSEPMKIARNRQHRAFDCVVVGAGVNGLATARALGQAGARTALLEQFTLQHAFGSSHGDSRSVRHYPAPEWMALWREAEALWTQLEEEAEVSLLQRVGVFTHAGESRRDLEALVRLGVPAEAVDAGEARQRFGIHLPDGGESYFDPTSGFILAARACEALAESCMRHGVTIIEGAAVSRLKQSPEDVIVSTDRHGTFTADVAIVTAGAWAREFLAPLDVDLPVYVSRETVAYFGAPGAVEVPVIIDYTTADAVTGQGIYALPSPSLGLKVAAHHSGVRSGEVPQSREPDARVVERLTGWVSERLPHLAGAPIKSETCLYTVAADEEFLLSREGRVIVGSACSGHAFKFATATGQRLASLALR
ncbi:MAG TPA: FAD-dependent oxidoreductase [Solirubrobacteraceae bacterium]|jgi:monomeric sarcosine oxidase|nr:FAD-dependent oxidoreductase [Solirubrobacteraceae bacterium]